MIISLALDMSKKWLVFMVDLALPKTGFIGSKKTKDLLRLFIGSDIKCGNLRIPIDKNIFLVYTITANETH